MDGSGGDGNSLAFNKANPWVDPTRTDTFQGEFTLDPQDNPRWTANRLGSDSEVRYDASGVPPSQGTLRHRVGVTSNVGPDQALTTAPPGISP